MRGRSLRLAVPESAVMLPYDVSETRRHLLCANVCRRIDSAHELFHRGAKISVISVDRALLEQES